MALGASCTEWYHGVRDRKSAIGTLFEQLHPIHSTPAHSLRLRSQIAKPEKFKRPPPEWGYRRKEGSAGTDSWKFGNLTTE